MNQSREDADPRPGAARVADWHFRIDGTTQLWDWADGGPPVRELTSVRGPRSTEKSRHVPVRAFSATVGGTVVVESGLEYDLLLDLDRDPDLVWFVSQPARLRLRGPGRTRWTHTPDLLALNAGGGVVIWDVRPTARQDEKFVVVSEATAAACADVGWGYRVFAGHVPARRYNLRWLSAYRRELGWYEPALPLLRQVVGGHGATIGSVLSADGGAGHLVSSMWHWLWHGELTVALDLPLTPSSAISPGRP